MHQEGLWKKGIISKVKIDTNLKGFNNLLANFAALAIGVSIFLESLFNFFILELSLLANNYFYC